MPILKTLPENSVRRLTKVLVRTIHLVGMAGLFGAVMMGASAPVYLGLTLVSGVVLMLMEAYSGWIWFVQLRGVALYLKLMLLLLIPYTPQFSIACLIAVVAISGFMSHAPSWIRYYSLPHGRVVHSKQDMLG